MYNPVHPGESLRDAMAAEKWTVTAAAAKLGCTRQTFSQLLNGRTGVSPAMALALERIGKRPKSTQDYWTAQLTGKSHREGLSIIELTNMLPTEEAATLWFEDVLRALR